MERIFFPTRGYWLALGVIFAFFGVMLASPLVVRFLPQTTNQDNPDAWGFIAAFAVCVLAFGVYGVLAYLRKRLVIGPGEVRSHGAVLVRAIRFADVVEAQWSLALNPPASRTNPASFYRPHRLRLRAATAKLTIPLDQFAQPETENELLELLRSCLGPGVRQDWETFQALREGRASGWSPPLFSIKRMARMLAVVTGIAVVLGASIGLCFQIQFPRGAEWWGSAVDSGEIRTAFRMLAAAKWPWSGWFVLDLSLYCGFWGLVIGISFMILLRLVEWVGLRARTIQARRLERELFSPSSDSRGG